MHRSGCAGAGGCGQNIAAASRTAVDYYSTHDYMVASSMVKKKKVYTTTTTTTAGTAQSGIHPAHSPHTALCVRWPAWQSISHGTAAHADCPSQAGLPSISRIWQLRGLVSRLVSNLRVPPVATLIGNDGLAGRKLRTVPQRRSSACCGHENRAIGRRPSVGWAWRAVRARRVKR